MIYFSDNRFFDRIEEITKHYTKLIMSAISDFSDKVTAHNNKVDAAVAGLQADIADLKAQIEALQSSSGTISPEDQALLDAIEARAAAIADQLEALNAQTEQAPTPPVEP